MTAKDVKKIDEFLAENSDPDKTGDLYVRSLSLIAFVEKLRKEQPPSGEYVLLSDLDKASTYHSEADHYTIRGPEFDDLPTHTFDPDAVVKVLDELEDFVIANHSIGEWIGEPMEEWEIDPSDLLNKIQQIRDRMKGE